MEATVGDKHTSFLRRGISYGGKKFYTKGLCYNTFYRRNLRKSQISQNACPLQVFSSLS